MRLRRVSVADLEPTLLQYWEQFLRMRPDLSSPFFRPEFTQAVARVRPDVWLAVLESEGEIRGVLPFQTAAYGTGRPVGGAFNDAHGWIAPDQLSLDPRRMLCDLHLRSYHFQNLVSIPVEWERAVFRKHPAPCIDLTQSFHRWYEIHSMRHRRTFHDQRKRRRSLEAALGPLTLEWHSRSEDCLQLLFDWKQSQYRRTSVHDILAQDWARGLLRELWSCPQPQCSAPLSVLRAGDRVVALHLGLQTDRIMHAWFPAYDHDLRRWSPGLQLWIELIRECSARGLSRLDFGPGDLHFKKRLCDHSQMLAEGVLDRSLLVNTLRRHARRTTSWLKPYVWSPSLRRWVAPFRRAIRKMIAD